MPSLPPNPVYPLRMLVNTSEGMGVIVARSFDKPVRYDVRLIPSNQLLQNVTEVTPLPKEDPAA